MHESPVTETDHVVAVRDIVRDAVMTARRVNVHYGDKHAVKNVSLDIGRNQVLAMIGPSGCGKSTFLRCLNRMNDTIAAARVVGVTPSKGTAISIAGRTAPSCGRASASYSRSPRRSRTRSTPTSRTDREFTAWPTTAATWTNWYRPAWSAPGFGRRSRIAYRHPAPVFPADNSNGFASRAPLP